MSQQPRRASLLISRPVAQYYGERVYRQRLIVDVPVINQRHPLASHFGRYPELVRPYFAQEYVPY